MNKFEIKDSGERQQFESGMVRDVTEGKIDYLLVRDGPMYERWAQHLTAGARKYAKRNWMQANSAEEYERFQESAIRHFEAWIRGERDEDHAAGVFFNINGAEYVESLEIEMDDPVFDPSDEFWDELLGPVPPDPEESAVTLANFPAPPEGYRIIGYREPVGGDVYFSGDEEYPRLPLTSARNPYDPQDRYDRDYWILERVG